MRRVAGMQSGSSRVGTKDEWPAIIVAKNPSSGGVRWSAWKRRRKVASVARQHQHVAYEGRVEEHGRKRREAEEDLP